MVSLQILFPDTWRLEHVYTIDRLIFPVFHVSKNCVMFCVLSTAFETIGLFSFSKLCAYVDLHQVKRNNNKTFCCRGLKHKAWALFYSG